jgi:hypothetical protein
VEAVSGSGPRWGDHESYVALKLNNGRLIVKVKYLTVLALAIGMLIVCAPSFAHHGSAATFESKTTTTKGTVVEWVWSNPHCLLRFDEKTDSGEVRHWVVETQAPANMIDAGWSKNSFKPGEEVTVDIRPAKSGKFVGILNKVVFADGRILSAERSNGVGSDLYVK